MANAAELKQMILTFRVSELHMLLGFAARNKNGRKNELQARALDLLLIDSEHIQLKILKLYKSLQLQLQSACAITLSLQTPTAAAAAAAAVGSSSSPNTERTSENAMQPQSHRVYGNHVTRNNVYPTQNAYHQQQFPSQVKLPSQYPIHPDVKLKRLPFYDIQAELLKPSSLVPSGNQRQQESTFIFHLSPQQADAIGMGRDTRPGTRIEYTTQVQLRFCLLETTCEQEDCFPPGIMVKVNGKVCPLPNPIPTNKPNVEPKRPPRPVNISGLIKISPIVPNTIQVQWSTDYSRGYVVSAYLVLKKTSEDLLNRLKAKGVRAADYTRAMIKDKLKEDADSEIATTSLRVSLICPLGKMRMTTPCRSSACAHFQCFDASLYLLMNEKKPTWMCPVCDKPAVYDRLVIDGYFQDVLVSSRLPSEGTEIQLNMDGSWSALVASKNDPSCLLEQPEPVKSEPDVKPTTTPCAKTEEKPEDVQLVTLSDSDDEPLVAPKKWQQPSNNLVFTPVKDNNCTTSQQQQQQPADSPGVIVLDSDSPPTSPAPAPPPFSFCGPQGFMDIQPGGYPRY